MTRKGTDIGEYSEFNEEKGGVEWEIVLKSTFHTLLS